MLDRANNNLFSGHLGAVKNIELSPEDKVLLLLPGKSDKLSVSWQGQFVDK